MKFSIIVPVYNVEKYIDKCLASILSQNYDNYEVIIINDGSLDNSQTIIDKYVEKDNRFLSFHIDNHGLSYARNYGLSKISGDYILFLDSDDFFDVNTLKKLYEYLNNKRVDIIKFNCKLVYENNSINDIFTCREYFNRKTEDVVIDLMSSDLVDPACLYCYNADFWKKNNFQFSDGKLHEDYGLIPIILYQSKSVSSTNFKGYYYLQRENSISKEKKYDKLKKGIYDIYDQYLDMLKELTSKPKSIKRDAIISYITECAIIASKGLKGKDYNEYVQMLKKQKVYKYIGKYNIKKIIKKIIIRLSINIYIHLFS